MGALRVMALVAAVWCAGEAAAEKAYACSPDCVARPSDVPIDTTQPYSSWPAPGGVDVAFLPQMPPQSSQLAGPLPLERSQHCYATW